MDEALNLKMGRLRFELRTSRLKAGCSTAELATLPEPWHAAVDQECLQAPRERITQRHPPPSSCDS